MSWVDSVGDIVGATLRGEISPEDFGPPSPRPTVHRGFAEPFLSDEQWEALEILAAKLKKD